MSALKKSLFSFVAAALVPLGGCSLMSTGAADGGSAVEVIPAAGRVGCALPNGPVAIAASTRANDPMLEITPSVAAVLRHAIIKQESLTTFDTDGSPNEVGAVDLLSKAKNPQARAAEIDDYLTQVGVGLQRIKADDPQAAPLESLNLAARTVHSRSDVGTLVLVDNGLQTVGVLRYQHDDLLLASGSDIVSYLRSAHELPDLSGLTVVLSGIGDTQSPQTALDEASRGRLVEQWKAIASAGGAKCVYVDPQPLTKTSSTRLPPVSVAAVPTPPKPHIRLRHPVALRADSVAFQDNSDKLIDPAHARHALKPAASEIIAAHYRVTLTGTTATAGTEAGRLRLSLERADAVKRVLVDLGVPADHISTRGVGTHYREHVVDVDAHGEVIPWAAAKNRAVFLSVSHH